MFLHRSRILIGAGTSQRWSGNNMRDAHLQAEFQAFRFIQAEDMRHYDFALLRRMRAFGQGRSRTGGGCNRYITRDP